MSDTTANGCASAIGPPDLAAYRAELKDTFGELIRTLPLTVCEGKNPGGAMGSGWQLQRLTIEAADRLIDRARHPAIGVMLGPGGGIDFDIDGAEELTAFFDLFDGEPPVLAAYNSGREGGEHRLAAFDERLAATGVATIDYLAGDGKKITVRIGCKKQKDGTLSGAQSIVPCSYHCIGNSVDGFEWSGKRYAWKTALSLDDVGLAKLPDTVVAKLLAAHGSKGKASAKNATGDNGQYLPGSRHDRLCSLAGSLRYKGCDRETIAAALHAENRSKCKPPKPDAEVDEIADYYAEAEAGKTTTPKASAADPFDFAKHVVSKLQHDGVLTLRFWRGSYWLWGEGSYSEVPVKELRGQIATAMRERWCKVGARHVSDALEHINSLIMLRSKLEPHNWLGDQPRAWAAIDCIATPTQIVHLPSLVDGDEVWSIPATPELFALAAVEYEIEPNAPKPQTWLTFLDSVWGVDPQCVKTLQEFMGYAMTADCRHQKILLITGPTRSGKGIIRGVLALLVGKPNVAAPSLMSLGKDFGKQNLVGKSVATIADVRLPPSGGSAAVLEVLLSISGGDPQNIQRKYLPDLICTLLIKFLMFSNELPQFRDASGAIVDRMILLQMTESFLGYEDTTLEKKLAAELPGIFNWALMGWARLRHRGQFVQPESSVEALETLRTLASAARAFVDEKCYFDSGASVKVKHMWKAWSGWCKEQDLGVGSKQKLRTDILAAFPKLGAPRNSTIGGETGRRWFGVELLDPVEE